MKVNLLLPWKIKLISPTTPYLGLKSEVHYMQFSTQPNEAVLTSQDEEIIIIHFYHEFYSNFSLFTKTKTLVLNNKSVK